MNINKQVITNINCVGYSLQMWKATPFVFLYNKAVKLVHYTKGELIGKHHHLLMYFLFCKSNFISFSKFFLLFVFQSLTFIYGFYCIANCGFKGLKSNILKSFVHVLFHHFNICYSLFRNTKGNKMNNCGELISQLGFSLKKCLIVTVFKY